MQSFTHEVIWMGILDLLRRSNKTLGDIDSYREFKTRKEVCNWSAEYYGAWSKEYLAGLSERDRNRVGWLARQPIEQYCGEAFREINLALWSGKALLNQYDEMESLLRNIISSAPHIPEPLIAYRLENSNVLTLVDASLKTGKPFEYKSYMSTSLLTDIMTWTTATFSDRNALLKLYIPEGTPGIYVDDIHNREESELILQRGLKVRVLRRRRNQVIGQRQDENSRAMVNVEKTVYECEIFWEGEQIP